MQWFFLHVSSNHHELPLSSTFEHHFNKKRHQNETTFIIIIIKTKLKWQTFAMSFFSTSGNESQMVVVTADIKPTWYLMNIMMNNDYEYHDDHNHYMNIKYLGMILDMKKKMILILKVWLDREKLWWWWQIYRRAHSKGDEHEEEQDGKQLRIWR